MQRSHLTSTSYRASHHKSWPQNHGPACQMLQCLMWLYRTVAREKAGIMDISAGKAAMHMHIPSLAPTCRPPLMQASQEQLEALDEATSIVLDSQSDGLH